MTQLYAAVESSDFIGRTSSCIVEVAIAAGGSSGMAETPEGLLRVLAAVCPVEVVAGKETERGFGLFPI